MPPHYFFRFPMSKKVFVASVAAAAVALSACSKESPENPSELPSGPSAVPAVPENPMPQEGEPQASSSQYEVLEFDQPYSIGDAQAAFKGKILLENGIVKSIEVPDAKGPQAAFLEGVAEVAYGKPVKGLQIDTISGASLTTAAFNEFLKTVN